MSVLQGLETKHNSHIQSDPLGQLCNGRNMEDLPLSTRMNQEATP